MDVDLFSSPEHVTPSTAELNTARAAIHRSLQPTGLGAEATEKHILNDLVPGFENSSLSSRYYGFVTGGVLPAALSADRLVSLYDQNCHTHLPSDRIATDIEHHALNMLCDLLEFDPRHWDHKIFTTGATAANIVGLATGREAVLSTSVAEEGLPAALYASGKSSLLVLSAAPHSSLRKACSVIGLGHACVVDVSLESAPHSFDLAAVKRYLANTENACIISVSAGEINTGRFATGPEEMQRLRALADEYGAWIHVDAAFGLLARSLPDTAEFASLRAGVAGLELADSIAGDAHKLFNVPYDCGFVLSRHRQTAEKVFRNPGAAYLAPPPGSKTDPEETASPLGLGIENSRRFRALPIYANMVAYGRKGHQDMVVRMVRFSRAAAEWIRAKDGYELLPEDVKVEDMYMIVLFRARDEIVNKELKSRINAQRKIYVSGTVWEGKPAIRIAVAHWRVDQGKDLPVVQEVLTRALE